MIENRQKIFADLILSVEVALAMKVAGGHLSREEAAPAFELLDALREGRFHFAAETWHDAHDRNGHQHYPCEVLLRARTKDGQPIKPLEPITVISRTHLQGAFDKALILSAIDQGLRENLMPISINTSARNMDSAEFWDDISAMLRDNFIPEDIKDKLTFEVTEDDLADNPCREVLAQMRTEFGCTFAIDDFYHDRAYHIEHNSGFDSNDWRRLENLTGIISYVKIDGETVEAALEKENPFDMGALIRRIKSYVPEAHIIMERIKNADQALDMLEALNMSEALDTSNRSLFDAFQGRDLSEDRKVVQKAMVEAARTKPKDLKR